ncbi:MAG: beta strand repeat-containing protein, partial [Ginsengibacter sp.]
MKNKIGKLIFGLFVVLVATGYGSVSAQSITVTNVAPTPVCAGSDVSITFDAINGGSGNHFDNSTTYTIYLSNSSGSNFSSLGTFSTTGISYNTSDNGTTSAITTTVTLPASLVTGSNYKISIGSANPAFDGSTGAGASSAFTVNALITPTVTATADPSNTFCADQPITFTATPANAGSYQWQIDGVAYGSNSTNNTISFPSGTIQNGHKVRVILTSNNQCASPKTATSQYVTVTVYPLPTVNAGGSMTAICQGGTSAALGGSYGGGATGAIWSDGGAGGTFSNNGGSTPNTATYTASSTFSGTVTLTLTSQGGSCGTVTDTKTIIVNKNPTVNAGGAIAAICQSGTSAALGGSYGGGATGAVWSDGGAGGTFSNNGGSTPNTATYTASPTFSGTVTLTLTSQGGSCGTVTDSKTITVNQNPTANAGGSLAAICQGGTSAAMGGSVGGGATGGTWSGGAGTWTNANNPSTATYTAGASESGTITLTLTTTGGVCGSTTVTKTITVNQNPTANAGGALAAICQGGTSAALGGSVGGGATGGTWSTTAGGTFNPGLTNLNATWSPPAGYSGTATLVLTTTGGSCGTTSASKTITVNPTLVPTLSITSTSTNICTTAPSGSTPVTFSISSSTNLGNAPSYQWLLNGSNIGGQTGSTYTANSLVNGAQISLKATSNATCPSPSTVTSSVITMTGYTPPAQPVFAGSSGNVNLTSGICPYVSGLVYTVNADPNATSYNWTLPSGWNITAGAGTNSITVEVLPSTATGNLSISVTAQNACGASSSKSLTVNVNTSAAVYAGADARICTGTSYTISDASVSGYVNTNSGFGWSALSGSFNNTSSVNPTYTPSITSGTVTLTLTSTKTTGNPNCKVLTDNMVLTVVPLPTAAAGTAISTCSNSGSVNITTGSTATNYASVTWTSSGTGTFANANSLTTATYTPSAA